MTENLDRLNHEEGLCTAISCDTGAGRVCVSQPGSDLAIQEVLVSSALVRAWKLPSFIITFQSLQIFGSLYFYSQRVESPLFKLSSWLDGCSQWVGENEPCRTKNIACVLTNNPWPVKKSIRGVETPVRQRLIDAVTWACLCLSSRLARSVCYQTSRLSARGAAADTSGRRHRHCLCYNSISGCSIHQSGPRYRWSHTLLSGLRWLFFSSWLCLLEETPDKWINFIVTSLQLLS